MSFASGQYGPDAQIDTLGDALIGAAVEVPSGYTALLDSLGNLTITGPATDSLTYIITPVGRSPIARTVRVQPLISEMDVRLGLGGYSFGGNYGIAISGTHTISTTSWEHVLVTDVSGGLPSSQWVEAVSDAGNLRIKQTAAAGEYDEMVMAVYFSGYSTVGVAGHYQGARWGSNSRIEPMVPAAVGPSLMSPLEWNVMHPASNAVLDVLCQDAGTFSFLIIVTPMMLGTDVA